MRKITYGGATSLDNFLARPDGAVDWLLWSKDVSAITAASWKTVDAVLMGRKTYEVALRSGSGGGGMPGVAGYVFSRTLDPAEHPGTNIVSTDAAEFVRDLKAQRGKGICLMGGGELARSLFEADLIDEVSLNVHPVLLGAGIPAFHPMTRPIDLELAESRPLAHGCILLTYRVQHR